MEAYHGLAPMTPHIPSVSPEPIASEYRHAAHRRRPKKAETAKRESVENSVKLFLSGVPQLGASWSQSPPRSENEVAATFARLSKQDITAEERSRLSGLQMLLRLTANIRAGEELDWAVLTGACRIVLSQTSNETDRREVMKTLKEKTKLSEQKRRALPILFLVLDMVHQSGKLGNRTYELLLRYNCEVEKPSTRNSIITACKRVAFWDAQHMKCLERILRENEYEINRPREQFDSSYLRVPNLLQALFAGIYSPGLVLEALRFAPDPSHYRLSELEEDYTFDIPQRQAFKFVRLHRDLDEFRSMTGQQKLPPLGRVPRLVVDIVPGAELVRFNRAILYPESGPWWELSQLLLGQRRVISMVAANAGMRVVDFQAPFRDDSVEPPMAIEMPYDGHVLIEPAYMGVALHMHSDPVKLRVCIPDISIDWHPNQLLCFLDKAWVLDELRHIRFIVVWLRVVPVAGGGARCSEARPHSLGDFPLSPNATRPQRGHAGNPIVLEDAGNGAFGYKNAMTAASFGNAAFGEGDFLGPVVADKTTSNFGSPIVGSNTMFGPGSFVNPIVVDAASSAAFGQARSSYGSPFDVDTPGDVTFGEAEGTCRGSFVGQATFGGGMGFGSPL